MITAGCLMIAASILGVAWHRDHQRTTKRAEDAEDLADQYAAELLEANAAQDRLTRMVVDAIKQTAVAQGEAVSARVDAEWASLMLAVAQGERDLHAESHACLPTLAGIRAGGIS